MKIPRPRFSLAVLVGLVLSPLALQAQPMSFETARQQMLGGSGKLAAAQAAVDSKALQSKGLRGLGGPVISVSAAALAYNANLNVDLDPLNQRAAQLGKSLAAPLASLRIPLPAIQFPSRYTYNRNDTTSSASVAGIWPIYTGGADDATRGFVSAQGREAQADADQTGHELDTLLVQRYFGAQLAARAASLRATAEQTIARHNAAAARMLSAGVISRVERLQAQAAYEEARRNAMRARDDAELAAIALSRTVNVASVVTPETPLFVLSAPVEPLGHFIDSALLRHPGLAKVAAKKSQAEQLHKGEEALRQPQVFGFGSRELKSGNADWVVGLGVRWTLYDSVDRNALAAASLKQVEQASSTDTQARSDIALLVEKNWRALEQARQQFLATQAGVDVAAEMLRLRDAGLREGTSTTLDLIDAETNRAKVQTERAQAAYDYVLALARLLESAALAETFPAYIQRADIKVN